MSIIRTTDPMWKIQLHPSLSPRGNVRMALYESEQIVGAVVEVSVTELRAALDEVAPVGHYTRTESPDYADGGVTAAAIEEEAEGDLWAKATPHQGSSEWWMARWKEAADRADGRDLAALQWKEATREHVGRARTALSYADAAQTARAEALARAEKAEQERDAVQAAMALAIEENDRFRAEQPRPLAADDITDEMVQRAWAWASRHEIYGSGSVRILLEEALTEPPSRPEWADLVDVLDATYPEGINGAENDYIARTLHAEGVRVTGAES